MRRKSNERKKLEGNRCKRPLDEPARPASSTGRCPGWLSADAKKEWKRLAGELSHLGLLTGLDVGLLAVFVQAVVDWRRAVEILEREGSVYKHADSGLWKKNPASAVANENAKLMLAAARELGLSPAARQGLDLPAAEDEPDPIDKLDAKREAWQAKFKLKHGSSAG